MKNYRSTLQIALVLLCIFSSVACQTVSMDFGGKLDKRSIKVTHNFFLWGLSGVQDIDVKEYCGNGIARIEEKNTPVNVLLTGVTFGLYNPRTSEFFCRF